MLTSKTYKLIGPFKQLLTMRNMPEKGALKDEQLEVIPNGAILIKNETIVAVDTFKNLKASCDESLTIIEEIQEELVALPGFIDAHTHICYAGSRAKDYSARLNGKSYLEIAAEGGGIWSTVQEVRKASKTELIRLTKERATRLLLKGITTVEAKSGYGLNLETELKMLQAIKEADTQHKIDMVATCLAAHVIPKDWEKGEKAYLQLLLDELVPEIKKQSLCKRFDIFIEEGAFHTTSALNYLNQLKKEGFQLTIHGDQFSPGGSEVAIASGAKSVDHLEASGVQEIEALSKSDIIPVVLPGASLGLGINFAPARKLLDAGCALAIASDWNPGSAPQGDLLIQAAILGAYEKLSAAEVFSGITYRAAKALDLGDRGTLNVNKIGDLAAFPTRDYREILYNQGAMNPAYVWKKGERIQ